jgi:hypothetical protein
MPSSTSKLLTRKKKAAQQFRRGSKTFRHKKNLKQKKNLRQKISVKKLYTKDKRKGKRFTRVARGFGFVDDLKAAVNYANKLEKIDKENKEKETECPLCMDNMRVDNATELNCGHKFHTTCLIENLIIGNHYTCPMCRRPMFDDQLEDHINYVLSDTPEEGLERAEAVAAEARAERARAAAIGSNTNIYEELVYMTNMVVELAALRVAREAAETPEAWAAVVKAAGARIDEMARTEAARVAAARTEAEREAAMASEEAARTEASRVAIVNATRARIQEERAAAERAAATRRA